MEALVLSVWISTVVKSLDRHDVSDYVSILLLDAADSRAFRFSAPFDAMLTLVR